jgi:hypothetical protein
MSWLASTRPHRAVTRGMPMAWCFMLLLFGRSVEGHAPPIANGISWIQSNGSERAVVRTNRGFIFELDEPGSFAILCNEAYQVGLSDVPPFAPLDDGRLLIGTYQAGLVVSSSDRCSFTQVPGPTLGINTIDIARAATGRFYAAVLPSDGSAAKLFASLDAETFEEQSTLAGFPSAIALVAEDASRVYLSQSIPQGNENSAAVFVSSDGGREFTSYAVELDESELRVFALAVDPHAPARLFVRTQSRDGVTPERLLLSEDAGATFEVVLTAPGPLDVDTEGDVVWAATAEGLYRSTDGGRTFARFGPEYITHITCLARRRGQLYACGYSESQRWFGVLVSKDDGATFDWFLVFPVVGQRSRCAPESDEGRLCAAAFRDWSIEQGLIPPDAPPDVTGAGGSMTSMPAMPAAGSRGTAASAGVAGNSVDAGAPSDEALGRENAMGCTLTGPTKRPAGLNFALVVLAMLCSRLRVCGRCPQRPCSEKRKTRTSRRRALAATARGAVPRAPARLGHPTCRP